MTTEATVHVDDGLKLGRGPRLPHIFDCMGSAGVHVALSDKRGGLHACWWVSMDTLPQVADYLEEIAAEARAMHREHVEDAPDVAGAETITISDHYSPVLAVEGDAS